MTTEPYKTGENAYDLLGIGDAGCWARIGANTSVTIYDLRLHCYYGDVREGGTIIDKRPALTADWTACCLPFCSKSPMCEMSFLYDCSSNFISLILHRGEFGEK